MNPTISHLPIKPVAGLLRTRGGGVFNLLCPNPELVQIEDVARSLSHIAMVPGLTERPYTAAQHAWEVSRLCLPQARLQGLLQHSALAYLGDVSQVLALSDQVRQIHDRIQRAVYERAGMSQAQVLEHQQIVTAAELRIRAAVSRDLLSVSHDAWPSWKDVEPASHPIVPMPYERARRSFIAQFHYLQATDLLGIPA